MNYDNTFLARVFDIDPIDIDIRNFFNDQYKWWPFQDKLWFNIREITKLTTIKRPILHVKKGKIFFYELKTSAYCPFLTCSPWGIINEEIIDVSTRKGRRKIRKILGTFFSFLMHNGGIDRDFFSREKPTIIAYVREWKKETPYAICIEYEPGAKTWNITGNTFPFVVPTGTVYFSISKGNSIWFNLCTFLLRGFGYLDNRNKDLLFRINSLLKDLKNKHKIAPRI